MPTDSVVRGTLEILAANLTKAGVKIDRTSPLLPDFGIEPALHADAVMRPSQHPLHPKSLPAHDSRRGLAG